MPAPTYGGDYLRIMAPLVSNPPNVGEATPTLDPAFITAWNQVQEMCPLAEDGDYAFKIWAANLAYRYKAGGTFTPAISSISPTTGVHGVDTVITVTGSNFDAGCTVIFNGNPLPSTTRTLTSVVFTAPAATIPIAGTYGVQIRNTDGSITAATNFTAT